METTPTFRDKLLTCAECGVEFVHTVGQQRQAYEETGDVEEPEFCPVCSVKIERMGRRPSEEVAAQEEESSDRLASNGFPNGFHPSEFDEEDYDTDGVAPSRARSVPTAEEQEEVWESEVAGQPVAPVGEASDEEESEEPTSGNGRPADYRTGEQHPLYGHEGELRHGRVKWFNDRKGFGFIILDDGNELFVHYSGIVGDGYKTLNEGQDVQLVLEDTDKGPQATQVQPVENAESGNEESGNGEFGNKPAEHTEEEESYA